jgi:preprotein translocase subunit YajC
MSHIRTNGEIAFQDRPGWNAQNTTLHRDDRVRINDTVLTRPGQSGTVIDVQGNNIFVQFADKKRLHYWRHELEMVIA